jgi:lysophospholipase L1-like esterase
MKLGLVGVLAACEPSLGRMDSPEPSAETVEQRPGPSRQRGDEILIAFLGDSLSAGLGVGEDEAFPKIVETRLRELGWKVEVINAGVSGDTRNRRSLSSSWVPMTACEACRSR